MVWGEGVLGLPTTPSLRLQTIQNLARNLVPPT